MNNRYQHIFTFFCLMETRLRPLGCRSSHACIGQNGFLPKEAMQISSQSITGSKRFRRWKNQTLWGQDDTDSLHDVYVGKHHPGVQLCPRSMCCCNLSLLGLRDSWLNAGLIATRHKLTANAWKRCPFSVEDTLVWMFGPDNTQISLERKIMQMEKRVVLLQNLPLKLGLFV